MTAKDFLLLAALASLSGLPSAAGSREAPSPRNIVFILSDDHRYDFMSFMDEAPAFLATPGFDRMAAEGAHLANAFVVTSLCSPSRASILTGLYPHRHGVVDNQSALLPGIELFPEALQEAGYRTAFIGKWHMGHHTDAPQPGFDRWVSFPGQGVYYDPELNIDGERRRVEGYITDLLTDYAIEWLEDARGREPFFLYLSHKAVHSEFEPAERHRGRFAELDPPYPPSMADSAENYAGKPNWVREQRNSWHGVDHLYHGELAMDELYRRYAETLLALDESVGRVLDFLEESGLADSTLVVYMGDNGFLLGEHGLIDKRQAYEESMRVPLLAWAPGLVPAGGRIPEMALNLDLAPTFLEVAGVTPSEAVDGRSLLPLLAPAGGDEPVSWRDEFVYYYFWEHPFPQTPTTLALRGKRFKYVFYHGIWDVNEFYDLVADPRERRNLIAVPEHQAEIDAWRERLFDRLATLGVEAIPVRPAGGWQAADRGPEEP